MAKCECCTHDYDDLIYIEGMGNVCEECAEYKDD